MRALQRNPECKDCIMSFEHIQYHGTVLFGASEKGITIVGIYHIKFFNNYKNEVALKKKWLLMRAI